VLVFGTAFVRARRVTRDGTLAEESADLVFGVDGEAIPASVS
jgi:hypothetical protein